MYDNDNWWETLLKIPDRNRTIRESIAINDVNILQTLIRHNSKTYSRIILKSISEERVLFQLSNDGFMFSKSFLLLVPTGGSHTVWISTIFEDFDALANINRYDTRVNRSTIDCLKLIIKYLLCLHILKQVNYHLLEYWCMRVLFVRICRDLNPPLHDEHHLCNAKWL